MNKSLRYNYNFALKTAIYSANQNDLPLLSIYFITPFFKSLQLRQQIFIMQGLLELQKIFIKNNLTLLIMDWNKINLQRVCKKASLVVTEFPYLKENKNILNEFMKSTKLTPVLVDSETAIPWFIASQKEEYSAATLRRKITKYLPEYLLVDKKFELNYKNYDFSPFIKDQFNLIKYHNECIENINLSEPYYMHSFTGGYSQAISRLHLFIEKKIDRYAELRNDPSLEFSSDLSPYLRCGMISPVEIAIRISEMKETNHDKFLDELIIRRELSINFVIYNNQYNSVKCLPTWAYKTLHENIIFNRDYVYSLSQFESAATHDVYWNTAQNEMKKTGKMQAYMRMYWGKKIIEWTETPEKAFSFMVYLNNKYSLDGNDPNSYAGIAWCFGKHDRAFKERKVFGKIRYMNDKGLKRKFDIDQYVKKIQFL